MNEENISVRSAGKDLKPAKITFSEFISSPKSKMVIKNALSDRKRCERFTASLVSVVSLNSELETCTPVSILKSALLAESHGLSLSPQMGQCYLMPRGNSKEGCTEAVLSISYIGLVQLALRSGQYRQLNVLSIKKGELEIWNPLTEELRINFIKDSEERECAETIGYVSCLEYLNGFRKTLYWSRGEMELYAKRYVLAYRKRNPNSLWVKDFDMMAYKTMLRQLITKWGIMSSEMQTVFEQEESFDDNEENIAKIEAQENKAKRVSIQDV